MREHPEKSEQIAITPRRVCHGEMMSYPYAGMHVCMHVYVCMYACMYAHASRLVLVCVCICVYIRSDALAHRNFLRCVEQHRMWGKGHRAVTFLSNVRRCVPLYTYTKSNASLFATKSVHDTRTTSECTCVQDACQDRRIVISLLIKFTVILIDR
jgi:hypothetical protein